MKWLIGIVTTLVLVGCTASISSAREPNQFVFVETTEVMQEMETTPINFTLQTLLGETTTNASNQQIDKFVVAPEVLEARQSVMKAQFRNATNITKTVAALKKRVGRTWYVFSGSTPAGWDCSGLVMWTYQQMGVELEHRASLQQKAGFLVDDPKVGDIVAFTYKNSKSAYHVGIYIGDGQMIHARRKGQGTVIESVAAFAGNYSKVTYTRILDTP
jgi:cell wall-associated NlpC family hydrolase